MCRWLVDPSHKGREYRRQWGEARLDGATGPSACRHFGLATGEVVRCAEGCPNNGLRLKVFQCAVHGRCTVEKRGVDVAGRCAECPEADPLAGEKYIAHGTGAAGLGDALLGLCAVRGYCEAHPSVQVSYGAASHTLRFTGLFDNPPRMELTSGRPVADGDLQIGEYFDNRCRLDPEWTRLAAYCESLAVTVPKLPKLREPAKLAALCADYAGCVVLAPCVALPKNRDREYPRHAWLALADRLRAAGKRVVVADNVHERLELFESVGHELVESSEQGWPPERLAGLMLNAACLVGNDSGLAHLAGLIGTPTVVLCGSVQGDKIFSFYPRAECLQGTLACDGCWWGGPTYRAELCRPGCASLASIQVATVLEAIARASRRGAAQVRIVTHSSKDYRALSRLTWPSKQAYAARYGLDWHHSVERGDLTWRVWLDQLELLAENAWLWVLDADAAVTGEQDVRKLLVGDAVLAVDVNGPNCGSMLLRNCARVRAAIGDAIEQRHSTAAGPWLEQGVLLALAARHGAEVHIVSQRTLNAYPRHLYSFPDPNSWAWQPGDLVCHVPGRSMAERVAALQTVTGALR